MRLVLRSFGVVLAFSAAALAVGRAEGSAAGEVGGIAGASVIVSDLDTYDDARLMRDLRDELDDVLRVVEDDDTDNETLASLILDALGDDGDTGYETDITLEDLEAEMEEAETSLEQVIERALSAGVSDANAATGGYALPFITHVSRAVGGEMQSTHPRTASKLERTARGARDAVRAGRGDRTGGVGGV